MVHSYLNLVALLFLSMLQKSPKPSKAEMESGLDGNICRCTGYRSLLDAVKSLAADTDIEVQHPVFSPLMRPWQTNVLQPKSLIQKEQTLEHLLPGCCVKPLSRDTDG